MRKSILFVSLFFATIAFCAENADKACSVEFYQSHTDLAKATVEKCKNLKDMNDSIADDCTRANTALILDYRKNHEMKYSKDDINAMKKMEYNTSN